MTMGTEIYVNLPVKDLDRSVAFFRGLGFDFNMQFTDETAACMVVDESIYVMLLTRGKFAVFTPNEVCDAKRYTEVLVSLSRPSREAVDEMVRKAEASGGAGFREPRDHGFMYEHGFRDPDGHIWELLYLRPDAGV